MKRSPMKTSTKPMSRGKPMKARRKKRPKVNGIDYPALCQGQPCYLMLPMVPYHNNETVVPCHSNQSRHGKSLGRKADDIYTVPGCYLCHAILDQGKDMTKAEKFAAWDSAYERWAPYREALIEQLNT